MFKLAEDYKELMYLMQLFNITNPKQNAREGLSN